MGAVGNVGAFADLLTSKGAPARFAKAIAGRMINGEFTAPAPDFEDERLIQLAKLLGITGILGSYEALEAGETIPRIGTAATMTKP